MGEILAEVLGVEVFRTTIAGMTLVGSHCCMTNQGALVDSGASSSEVAELASLLQIPVAAGVVANDSTAFCGVNTTSTELSTIERIFKLEVGGPQTSPLVCATNCCPLYDNNL